MTAKDLQAAEKRWAMRSYDTRADKHMERYRTVVDDWWLEVEKQYSLEIFQCGCCRFFAALDTDYGICCREHSPNDGMITFEHGGCKLHSRLIEKFKEYVEKNKLDIDSAANL